MFCKKCGSEISESNETCPKCGTFLNDKFATEEYDPLLALDKVENVEDNVIWQEAPLGDDAIILNAENVEKSSEPLIKESNVDGSFVEEAVEKIENEENNYKGSVAQGLRAAKSTIAHPIKPRKRIKPKSEPSKPENSQVIEAPIEETNIEHSESVESIVEEVPQMEETIPVSDTMETNIIEETVVEEVEVPKETVVEEEVPVVDVVEEEVVVTDDFNNSSVNDDEVIDIFDDFVVDDSIVILDETPEIIEELPEVEETTQVPEVEVPKETVVEEVPGVEETTQVHEVEVPKETVVEEVPVVQEEVVEEAMIVDDVVKESIVDNEVTPEEALFEENFFEEESDIDEPIIEPIETPIMEEVQTKLEEIAKTEEKLESTEETIIEKDTADKTELASGVAVAGAAVAGAAARAKQATTYESEKTVDDTIIKSIDETTLDKENLKTVDDDRDLAIKSKFNTSFDDEDYEEGAVDENINSLTSKITTVLIILLVLIIAIVVATFLLQQIGL